MNKKVFASCFLQGIVFAKGPQYLYAFAIKGYGHDSFNSF